MNKVEIVTEDGTFRPNPEFISSASWQKRRHWANALRSGKYKQGRDYLYRSLSNSYCCLGVLLAELRPDVYTKGMGTIGCAMHGRSDPVWLQSVDEDPELAVLSPADAPKEAELHRASMLNDYYNLTFDQIADLIDPAGASPR